MSESALGLLGLGLRAGSVVVGSGGVRRALQRDELRLVVVARDYSDRTRDKVVRLAAGKGVSTMLGPTARELGQQLGRGAVQAVGVRDPNLARGLEAGPNDGFEEE